VGAYIQRTEHLSAERKLERFMRRVQAPARVLSVGCGYGKDEAVLAARGYGVTGIDLSAAMIAEAKRRVPAARFQEMDMRSLLFEEYCFDGVYCMASLHHLSRSDAPQALREMRRVLVPSGTLFISVKEGSGDELRTLGTGTVRETFYDDAGFREMLQGAGFTVAEFSTDDARTATPKRWLNYYCN